MGTLLTWVSFRNALEASFDANFETDFEISFEANFFGVPETQKRNWNLGFRLSDFFK
jgi:hypothetical protein